MDNKKTGSIATGIIVILFFVGVISSFFSSGEIEEWEVKDYVVYYLKDNLLKDPKSYESVTWSSVSEYDSGFKVTHTYRAKNSFGGYVVETHTFYLDKHGNVVSVR
ncbi:MULTISPECIES: hypothetical protein [unclassified Butyricimonas]|uniref:hypothetical protein n=1 Tax=unclassified Butyricimonas TaxID=2637652 RepID=UPI00114524FB|nr:MULTISPECIES: hypothetical protein [unclassified Butyricimonas]